MTSLFVTVLGVPHSKSPLAVLAPIKGKLHCCAMVFHASVQKHGSRTVCAGKHTLATASFIYAHRGGWMRYRGSRIREIHASRDENTGALDLDLDSY